MDMNVSSDPNVLKKRLRVRMAGIREMLGPEGRAAADAAIAEKVIAHPSYVEAEAVFAYLSVGSEVDTRSIIRDAWSRGKLVAVPRCVPKTNLMEWYRIEDFDGLESGSFGIEEPPADPTHLVEVPGPGTDVKAVAIVPGYTFDPEGYRLGYGGGFYDVFLEQFTGTSIGLCRAQFKSAEPLPCEEHDLAVDLVITE
jgi:5-formyltetrahydrofolate cyclo-ligase